MRAAAAWLGALFVLLGMVMPTSWMERSIVSLPPSSVPGSSGVVFFHAGLFLNGLLLLLWWRDRALTADAPPAAPAMPTDGSAPRPTRGEYLLLGLILLLAAGLRLWKLGGDLWFDEVMDLVYYVRGSFLDLLIRFPGHIPQVFAGLVSKVLISFFGESSVVFRMGAAVFGVLGVWATYILARRVSGRGEALVTALLMATSYHHVFFSQNARGYTIQVFFTVLSTYGLLRATERDSRSAWAGYAIASILNLYTSIFSALITIGLSLGYLGRWLQRRLQAGRAPSGLRGFLWSSAFIVSASFLLYSPLMPGILVRLGITAPNPGSGRKLAGGFLEELLQGLQVGYGTVVLVGLLLVFLVGLFSLARKELYGTALLVLPGAMGFGAVALLGLGSHPRYFFYVLPAGLILIVHGIVTLVRFGARVLRLPGPERISWAMTIVLALAIGVVSMRRLVPYYSVPKQDFTGALNFAEQNRAPGDELVAVGLAAHAYKVYYAPQLRTANSVDEVRQLRQNGHRVWLLYTLSYALRESDPELMRYVEENFTVVRRFPGSIYNGGLFVCRAEPVLNTSPEPAEKPARAER